MIVSRLTLAKSIHKVAKRLSFLYWLKSVGRPIISPLNIVLSHIPEQISLMDIGCGNGTLLHLVLEFNKVKYAYGYDISDNSIANSVVLHRPSWKCLSECRKTMPKLSKFEVITLLDVLHHIPASKQINFIEEIIHKMSAGSILILMDINASNFIGRWFNQLHDLLISQEWVHPRRMQELEDVFNQSNVELVSSSKHQSLWYAHYLFVVRK